MCVYLTVKLSDEDSNRIDEIAAASRSGGLDVEPVGELFQKRTTTLHISEPGKGCSCSFMNDNEYQGDGSWDLQPHVLLLLAPVLAVLRSQTTGGLAVDFNWAGDDIGAEEQVTLDEMVQIVHTNKLKPEVRYVVV